MSSLDKYAKALVAAFLTAFAFYQAARGGGSPGGEAVLAAEWVDIAAYGIASGVGVWAIPNRQDPPQSS